MNKHFLYAACFTLLTVCAEAVVYRPGLTQAKFNTNTVPFGTLTSEIMASSTADVVPGTVMANIQATENNYSTQGYTNVLSGLIWNWNQKYTTFGYAGQIFVNEGTTYTFGKYFDDGASIHIAGEQIFSHGTNNVFVQADYVAASTGWVPIEICVWDATGSKGPAGSSWGNDLGLAYNTTGVKTIAPKTAWSPILDDGNMTFLRTTTDEIFVRVEKVTSLDGVITVNIITESPCAARLTIWLSDVNGGEDAAAWGSNSQALDIVAGSQSYSFDLPIAGLTAAAPWCGIRLESLDAANFFREWTTPFPCGANPAARPVIINEIFYTNVIATAWLDYLGLEANTADVFLELSLTAGMTDIFRTVQIAEGIAATPAEISGFNLGELEPATTYFIRVRSEGDNSAVGFSDVTSFTTLTPSAPTGDCMLRSISLRSLGFDYQITDYGLGAQECTEVWAEIATLEDFSDMQSTLLASDIKGEFPIINSFVLPNLHAGTQYFVRVRFRNLWELDMRTEPIAVSTFASPYEFSNVGAINGANGMDVFLSLVRIDSGAELSVELLLDDVPVQTWPTLTSTQKLTFNLGMLSGTHTVKYRINGTFESANLPEEILQQTVSGESNTYTAGAVRDLFDFHFRVGDIGQLPPPMAPDRFYRVMNPSVAELQADGLHVTALAPGGTGIELWQNTFTGAYRVARADMVVVPPAIGNAKVFRYIEKSSGSPVWEDVANWECLSHLGDAGYPQNADDIAMILTTNRTAVTFIFNTTQSTFGGLYVGHFGNVIASIQLESLKEANCAFTMARLDGEVPFVQATCGGSNVITTVNFGSASDLYQLGMSLPNGLIVNGGFLGEDRGPNWQQTSFGWRAITMDLPAGTMLKAVEGQPYDGNNNNSRFQFEGTFRISGGGTLWNDSAYTMNISGDWSGFTGLFRDTGYGHKSYDRNGNFQFKTGTITNAMLEIKGFVSPSLKVQESAGYSAVGLNHNYSSPSENPGNQLPAAGIVLESAMLEVRGEDKTGWTDLIIPNATRSLTLANGLSRLTVRGIGDATKPLNTLTVKELKHPGYATLFLSDSTIWGKTQRTRTTFVNCADYMIGGGGAYDSGINSIVPWIVSTTREQNDGWLFSTIDETGLVRTSCVWRVALRTDTFDPHLNATVDSTSITLLDDVTVNSLALNSSQKNNSMAKEQCLGTNRTLTVTSGGLLFLNGSSNIGRYDLPAEMAGNLVFPNTAYVHAVAAENNPNQIAAKISAPNGFVCGYVGALSLMNDQTGIRGKIYVNNGTLFLGYPGDSVGAKIDCGLQIVGGGSKVCITKSGTFSLDTEVVFEDANGFAGKMELSDGVEELCSRVFIGTGAQKRKLPFGTHGSSESGAQFVDDVHFSGTGILTVRHDPRITIMRLF